MSDNHDLLNDKDVCSFEEHGAGIFLLKIKEEPDCSDSSKYVSANTYPNCYL